MKRLILQILAISFLIGVIGLFVNEPLVWVKGLLFGTIFSILRLLLINATIKSYKNDFIKAKNYTISQYYIRYFITALLLLLQQLSQVLVWLVL